MKKFNIRLTKKVVIPVVAVGLIIIGFFAVKSVIYNNKKSASAAAAAQAYKVKSGADSNKVIMKIDGVNVTYGELMCSVKLGDAYSSKKENTDDKEKIKSSFIDKFLNITQYSEVTKMMEDEKDFKPDSDEEIKAIMKSDLESQSKSSDAQVAGVAEVKLRHIDEDFETYKNQRVVSEWINRKKPGVMSTNMTQDDAKSVNDIQNAEIVKVINSAIDNSKIEYIDQSYSWLTKDLIPKP